MDAPISACIFTQSDAVNIGETFIQCLGWTCSSRVEVPDQQRNLSEPIGKVIHVICSLGKPISINCCFTR